MTDAASMYFFQMHFRYKYTGWGEKYYINAGSWAQAVEKGERIARYRVAILAANIEAVWGRVSLDEGAHAADAARNPRNTKAVPGFPTQNTGYKSNQTTGFESVEMPHTSLLFRQETADGLWTNRMIRGIEDDLVNAIAVNFSVTPEPFVAGAQLPDPSDHNNQVSAMFRAYLSVLRDDTVYVQRRKANETPKFRWDPWENVIFRGVRNKKIGLPFGTFKGRRKAEEENPG